MTVAYIFRGRFCKSVVTQFSDVCLTPLVKTLSHENFFTHLSTDLQSQKLAYYHVEFLPFRYL